MCLHLLSFESFGCLCYSLSPSTKINKLQARFTRCVFLGYYANHRQYRCSDISSFYIVISCHILFDEYQISFTKVHIPILFDI